MNKIIFDLDGTLALDHARAVHLKKDPKDWDSYFSLAASDLPHGPIHSIFHALWANGAEIEVWTGRIESLREITLAWCEEHGLPIDSEMLRMRPTGSRQEDTEMKREWLLAERALGNEVILAFEDRQRVVNMWRAEGVVCCQVAPGDF